MPGLSYSSEQSPQFRPEFDMNIIPLQLFQFKYIIQFVLIIVLIQSVGKFKTWYMPIYTWIIYTKINNQLFDLLNSISANKNNSIQ